MTDMHAGILQALRTWRAQQARSEGVETFRILPNAALDALSTALPRTKEELLAIKGIKEAKCAKYGGMILSIVGEYVQTSSSHVPAPAVKSDETSVTETTLSVSQFLDGLNIELSGMAARVQGEVSSVDVRERVTYFTIKDTKDESVLNCLIFRYQYEISGVTIAVGDEIVVEGIPDVYKPSGRLSLKVGVIELAGLGALKKAYDALKKKLEEEGLFAPERKRALSEFPERVALITSERGAAIGDFTMNLGSNGLRVDFYPTSVEGKKAVFEIIRAIRYFNRSPEKYDALVIVRGGGSLESLQAFNNEALVREVAASRIPTLLGVGHEKDVTLAALVADVMVSTPTATARTLRAPWDAARQLIEHFRRQLPALFGEQVARQQHMLGRGSESLLSRLRFFRELASVSEKRVAEKIIVMQVLVRQWQSDMRQQALRIRQGFHRLLLLVENICADSDERLKQYDPKRVLKLGYSLVRKGGKIVKDVSETAIGDILEIQLGKGGLRTKVERILPHQQ